MLKKNHKENLSNGYPQCLCHGIIKPYFEHKFHFYVFCWNHHTSRLTITLKVSLYIPEVHIFASLMPQIIYFSFVCVGDQFFCLLWRKQSNKFLLFLTTGNLHTGLIFLIYIFFYPHQSTNIEFFIDTKTR